MKRNLPAILALTFRGTLSRNWQAKLVALALAFLFWYSVKSEISGDGKPRKSKLEATLEQHSLGGATRL
jgi:hypothetical protein